ncbi:hypothetical protein HMF7854_08320 [Sphingomonas ginkgonis]|uniref:TonB-dependent receptor-like beta-barrel domain-containing protein n=1 Tax=Sphingomonas ginkgonis TaxID=2315330 RepID=A0A3R9WNX1_9SPHN|nr:TonB-dependent receptor [Sphingomonas ginkgonis]RST30843.1 hypothetical protein HMF7854_08320 [Sphingomonas ginkgonis]
MFQNFLNAVNATRDASGNIVCAPGYTSANIATISPTCAPLNLFGTGQASQAAINYITAIATPVGINHQRVFTASTAGPLFKLPGGNFSVALGYEHRYESTSFSPGAYYQGEPDGNGGYTSFGQSVTISGVKGSYHTNEFFGEATADIVGPSNNVPLIRSLELHGAARWVNNSIAGKDLTWTAEGRWNLVRDLGVRANFTRAIRAPSITEAFNPSSSYYDFANDPCDQDYINSGPDPATRAKNCAAAGVPAGFVGQASSFLQAVAGNPNLQNEKSRGFSGGVVLTPHFVRGLTLSADYINIRLRSAITQLNGTQVADACYDSSSYPNNQYCPLVTRDPTNHQITFIQSSYFNAASFAYKGIVAALDYRVATPFLGARSTLGLTGSYQYLKSLTQTADQASQPTHLSGSIGYPKHSAVVTASYANGPVNLFTTVNYTGKVRVDPDTTFDYYQYPTRKAVAFVNSGFSVDAARNMTFRFIVDNVLNTKPPYPSPAGGGSVAYFPGLLGRYFRAGVDLHF